MIAIVKTEFMKLKRYYIIWAGIALMLLSVLLTLFTSIANDGSIWDFSYLSEQVIKNNMSTIFPMCITLITGYIISREQKDDVLKNIQVIPISFKKLMMGKLIICGVISIFLGIICTIFTIITQQLVQFPGFTIELAFKSLLQITVCNLMLYLAVLPIIALTSQLSDNFLVGTIIAFVYGYGGMFAAGNMSLANIYPVTASLGVIGYRSYDQAVNWNMPLCITSIMCSVIIAIIVILIGKDKETKHTAKKENRKVPIKKGW